jgi:hypothetical protein
MKFLIAFLDEVMFQLYTASISLMDIAVITIISTASSMYSSWFWIALLPWIVFSAAQKVKHSR